MSFAGFGPDFTQFLKQLAANNNRDWFQANKKRYQESVQEPFLDFVAALAGPLKAVSPHLVADSRKTGGSMMRIYRDTRFSKDKTPYKTHVTARFTHEQADSHAAPAGFLRIGPEEVVVGGGVWQPDNAALTRIRQHIDKQRDSWDKIRRRFTIESGCGLYGGDMLTRVPRGFSADHPFVEDLKRKSFAVFTSRPSETIQSESFLGEVVGDFEHAAPLLDFLAKALGFPF